MRALPLVFLLCVFPLYGQGAPKRAPWLTNSTLSKQGGAPSNRVPAQTLQPAETLIIEDDPGYKAYDNYLNDSNQYLNLENFSFSNMGSLGDVPLIPPMPPVLTNGSSQDIIDYIKNNMDIMSGQAQSNTEYVIKPKPQKERAFLDGRPEYILPKAAEGLWWRFYSQNTSIFNIPAACEEMLVIAPATGEAVWMQTIHTAGTVQSKSQRRLEIAMYMMGTGGRNNPETKPLWFFYYPAKTLSLNPDPAAAQAETRAKKIKNFPVTNLRTVNETPAYFVQIFPEQGFMQMSKSPDFPPDQTMFWRRFPRDVPNIIAPPAKTNENLPLSKAPAANTPGTNNIGTNAADTPAFLDAELPLENVIMPEYQEGGQK